MYFPSALQSGLWRDKTCLFYDTQRIIEIYQQDKKKISRYLETVTITHYIVAAQRLLLRATTNLKYHKY